MSTTFMPKYEVACTGEAGDVLDKDAVEYDRNVLALCLTKKRGDEITWNSTRFIITGLNMKRSRYPVCAKRADDGRLFKLPLVAATR
jgi:hypothetical protein